MEDVLQNYDLTPQQLDIPMPFNHRMEFAEKLTEWEPLVPRLGLTEVHKASIRKDNPQNHRSQCSACLTKWHDKFGSQATFLKLAQALKDMESMDRVEKLIDIFKTAKPVSILPSDLNSEEVPGKLLFNYSRHLTSYVTISILLN